MLNEFKIKTKAMFVFQESVVNIAVFIRFIGIVEASKLLASLLNLIVFYKVLS